MQNILLGIYAELVVIEMVIVYKRDDLLPLSLEFYPFPTRHLIPIPHTCSAR